MKKTILLVIATALAVITVNALLGDLNSDCKVDLVDLGTIGRAWQTTPTDALWNANADLDSDGYVGYIDLGMLQNVWGDTCPTTTTEPTTTTIATTTTLETTTTTLV